MTPRQLTLDLPVRPALGREAFFVSPANATALAALEAWRDWPLGKMVLTGPPGSGKTHLAHVWAAMTGARIVPARDLSVTELPALVAAGAVVVEDADAAGRDDAALFHLHNLCAEAGRPLLLTAAAPTRDWDIALPDLQSRLSAAPVAQLSAPDDSLLRAVILKQFADRQITVSPQLVEYLLRHGDRSFAGAQQMVRRLDRAALAEGRPVSRALAAQVLAQEPTDTG